jgi:hypothetical protein
MVKLLIGFASVNQNDTANLTAAWLGSSTTIFADIHCISVCPGGGHYRNAVTKPEDAKLCIKAQRSGSCC